MTLKGIMLSENNADLQRPKLHDSIYVIFLHIKWQNYRNGEHISNFQGYNSMQL